jgi:predicted GNAT family N-acyltransferase
MLAVHKDRKRQKVGEKLLIHALRKAEEASQRCGAYAVVVDSLSTDEAMAFYTKYGFLKLKRTSQDGQIPMFILMRKVREMLNAAKSADSKQANTAEVIGAEKN